MNKDKEAKRKIFMKDGRRSGQAMLIAVLSLGGAILGATTVAGLLTLYQLRAVNDSKNSAKAIFAADTGVEWTLFDYYCNVAKPSRCGPPTGPPNEKTDLPTFAASGATLAVACYDGNGATSTCSSASTTSAIATGISGNSRRAFAVMLTTTTVP